MRYRIPVYTVIIFLACLVSGCGGDNNPIIPLPQFNQVSSFDNIPLDFNLTYSIRDEYASPPYLLTLSCSRQGLLYYELKEDTQSGLQQSSETSYVTEDDVLALYNFLVSQGYFVMDALYTIRGVTVPIEIIEVAAKGTEFRVEYHSCPNTPPDEPPLPDEFNRIIEYFFNLAEDYLDNI